MALIDIVKNMLVRLWEGDNEWRAVFSQHGWNCSLNELIAMPTDTLEDKLLHDVLQIDRSAKGFEDFSENGNHMIEASHPSRSLLYHALVSPHVYQKIHSMQSLQVFPSLFEIDMLENWIYAKALLDVNELIQREGAHNVAIAVLSYEYRQAMNTTHRNHADLCFSRTGVARVGTDVRQYGSALRAFTIFPDSAQKKGMRVLPARYGVFVVLKRHINDEGLSVLPYMGRDGNGADIANNRAFWVPVHKLFPGPDCLPNQGHLSLSWSVYHENIKLKKVCEYLDQTAGRDLTAAPYTMTEDLVEVLRPSDDEQQYSAGIWISPLPHPLVTEAKDETGKQITITVPPDPENHYFAALTLRDNHGARAAPEYVNVRKKLEADGTVTDLNTKPNVAELVAAGNYEAVMHIDYTCDGWIRAVCPELDLDSLPAYSLITAPDFMPFTEQRELIEWDQSSSKNYWALKPWALSDTRLLPNITLKNSSFSTNMTDNTIHTLTAIVGALDTAASPSHHDEHRLPMIRRSSCLPDAAAGEFQPGWDITWDRTNNLAHLSAYGLGSPFLEDAKLCAALSTFWPAAAPDIARSYVVEGWPAICPLTDEEIGLPGGPAWDGIKPPQRINRHGEDWVALPDFNHVDYVVQGLRGEFSIATIGNINVNEYKNRVDALWHIYQILNALSEKAKWRVLSFRKIEKMDPDLINNIGSHAVQAMQNELFFINIYRRGRQQASDDNLIIFEEITRENQFYIDNSSPRQIWQKSGAHNWQLVTASAVPA